MSFIERTFCVPARRGEPLEIMVDMDSETDAVIDVYTYASDLADMGAVLRSMGWMTGLNHAMIHAENMLGAWEYIKDRAIDFDSVMENDN